MSSPLLCIVDNQRQRRTLARLRRARMWMRKRGILLLSGYNPPNRSDPQGDCQKIWRRYGWQSEEARRREQAIRSTFDRPPVLNLFKGR